MERILIYLNSMSNSGGIERVVANLSKELVKDYEVCLLTKDSSGNSFYCIPKEVKRYTLEIPLELNMWDRYQRIRAVGINFYRSICRLRKFFKRYQFDYIYTTTPLNSLEVSITDPALNSKLVISEHASAFSVNSIYQMIKQYLYPRVYCISVPNRMDAKVYRKWGCNSIYIPHIVTFIPQKRNRLDTKIALSVGRYTSDKRQELLIRCWSKIKDKRGWVLWIVGAGEEENRLRRLIDELHVTDSVFLIPSRKNIELIYRKSSLFLFTSRAEGFGMVLLEAMSFGIPCISFDCPSGPRDIIKNELNGYLVDNGNGPALTETISDYFMLPAEKIDYMSRNAMETVEKWKTDKIMKKWKKNVFI